MHATLAAPVGFVHAGEPGYTSVWPSALMVYSCRICSAPYSSPRVESTVAAEQEEGVHQASVMAHGQQARSGT